MRHPAVINELSRRIGLNADSLGDQAGNSVIVGRMRHLGLTGEKEFLDRLAADPGEFQKLIDEIVVSETWFFRGTEFFDCITRQVRQLITERPVGDPVRILSVACSTGEEPYSIAIALEQSGIPAHAVRIDAVDVSARNIEFARKGRYGEFSFRQSERTLRDQFFSPAGDRLCDLQPGIKSRVSFRIGNLLDPHFLAEESAYDLICCRNVLIYLTPAARQSVIKRLARLLKADGLLGLGHAESSELSEPRWVRFGPEAACLFRHCPAGGDSVIRLPVASGTTHRPEKPSAHAATVFASESRTTHTSKRRLPMLPVSPEVRTGGGDCWNIIGVRGDHSCKELTRYDHCHNCHVYSNAGRRFLDNAPPEGYLDEWTERLAEPIREQDRNLENVLIFRIREEWLALPVACVTEVTLPRSFHRVPHRGGLLDGIINVRGELHLLVRMDELLGLSAAGEKAQMTRKSRMILAGTPSNLWAFVVGEVDRVRRFPASEALAAPATVARSSARFSRGVLAGNGRSIGLLDDAKLFEALRSRLT